LVAFSTAAEVLAALDVINRDYPVHARAAQKTTRVGLLIFRRMKEAVAGGRRTSTATTCGTAAIYLGAGRADPLRRAAK